MDLIASELAVYFCHISLSAVNRFGCDLMIRNIRGSRTPPVKNHLTRTAQTDDGAASVCSFFRPIDSL